MPSITSGRQVYAENCKISNLEFCFNRALPAFENLYHFRDELEFLEARSKNILEKFYATAGHQKREKTETKRFLIL